MKLHIGTSVINASKKTFRDFYIYGVSEEDRIFMDKIVDNCHGRSSIGRKKRKIESLYLTFLINEICKDMGLPTIEFGLSTRASININNDKITNQILDRLDVIKINYQNYIYPFGIVLDVIRKVCFLNYYCP